MTSNPTFCSGFAKGFVSFFFSLALSLFFPRNHRGSQNTLGKKEDEKRRRIRKRQRNRAKTFSLLLLKERGTIVRRASRSGKSKQQSEKPSPFPI